MFFPLWSWDQGQERLFSWMKRYMAEAYPELGKAAYGRNAVAGLVDRGLVLPFFDGLDALPARCRDAVLSDGEFLAQDRLVLTCRRTGRFGALGGFAVIEPRGVGWEEAVGFLRRVTSTRPGAWDEVEDHACGTRPCCLSEALSRPRIVYLASMVYGSADQDPAGGAGTGNDPAELTDHAKYPSPEALEELLLSRLIPALIPDDGNWAQGLLSHRRPAEEWLRNLARLDLRDPDDKNDSALGDPGVSRIAWWNLHRGLPWLDRWQAPLRALATGLIAFAIITALLRISDSLGEQFSFPWRYSLLTAAAYSTVIVAAGSVLGDRVPLGWWHLHRGRRWLNGGLAARRLLTSGFAAAVVMALVVAAFVAMIVSGGSASHWWGSLVAVAALGAVIVIGNSDSDRVRARLESTRAQVFLAAIATFCCFGFWTWLRLIPIERAPGIAFRVAFTDGLFTALIVVLTFIIARVPAPPRTVRAVDSGSTSRSEIRGFTTTIILGIAFGLISAVSVTAKGLYPYSLSPSGILSGIFTGLDFVLGAWLFRFAQIRFHSRRTANPLSAARTDLAGALVCPLILGVTFAVAFGASDFLVPVNHVDFAIWFVFGTALGSLGTEWPLYITALTCLALVRRGELPLRLLRFLEGCRARGILRAVGQEYQIHDDGLLRYLLGPMPSARHATPDDGQAGSDAVSASIATRVSPRPHGAVAPNLIYLI